jgi:hypothetical protein
MRSDEDGMLHIYGSSDPLITCEPTPELEAGEKGLEDGDHEDVSASLLNNEEAGNRMGHVAGAVVGMLIGAVVGSLVQGLAVATLNKDASDQGSFDVLGALIGTFIGALLGGMMGLDRLCMCSGSQGVPLTITAGLFVPLLICTFYAARASDEKHGGIHPWFVAIVSNCTHQEYADNSCKPSSEFHQVFFFYNEAMRANCTVVDGQCKWVEDKTSSVMYDECDDDLRSLNTPSLSSAFATDVSKFTLGGRGGDLSKGQWANLSELGTQNKYLSRVSFWVSLCAAVLVLMRVLNVDSPECKTISVVLGNSFVKNLAGILRHGALMLLLVSAYTQVKRIPR